MEIDDVHCASSRSSNFDTIESKKVESTIESTSLLLDSRK